jgi:glutamate synthase domain-containing protein 2
MKKRGETGLARTLMVLCGAFPFLKYFGRKILGRNLKKATKIIMTDHYHENLWEFISATKRVTSQKIVELNLRSEWGKPVERPLGSPKRFPSLDGLMFSFAQIETMPVSEYEEIDIKVTIGKKARRPLSLETPIMIGGMAYGFALSEKFRIAMAKGSALAGTAINTGQGGMLPREREAARQMILQYNRGHWSKEPEILRQADALELHFGQGASGGTTSVLPAYEISAKMRRMYGVKRGKNIIYPAHIPGILKPRDLSKKVKELRKLTDGIPIGAKIAAGDEIEKDMAWCLEAGLDFIAVSGAEGASKGSPPTLLDDLGLPVVFALSRAVNFLEKTGARKEIDLIIDGKLITPGDFLKVMALGADAVYIGTAALFATAHTQVLKAFPFEPPTAVALHVNKLSRKFKIEKGAENLHNFLRSCASEMKIALSAMGKTSIRQLAKEDLIAIDPLIAEVTGVRLAHIPKP